MFKLNGKTLRERKDYMLTFLAISIIFFITALCFIPLMIYRNIRNEINFNFASIEGVIEIVLLVGFLVFLGLFIVELVFYLKEKKQKK